ncbi:MAG: hypothetical protein ACR2JF_01630 [Iamia sp.]
MRCSERLRTCVHVRPASILHALAHNQDPRPVEVGRRRSVGSQCALGPGARSTADLDAVLVALVDRVTVRLRKGRRIGRTVVLRLRFDDYTRATRSRTFPQATAHTSTILAALRALLAGAAPLVEERGLTLLGVAVSNLADDRPVQLTPPSTSRAAPLSTPPSTVCASASAEGP